jgi:hypothetical protein
MLLYIVPIILFGIITGIMYKMEDDKSKMNKIKLVLPGVIVSVIVFFIIKYRDNLFNQEPIMGGNYFDA